MRSHLNDIDAALGQTVLVSLVSTPCCKRPRMRSTVRPRKKRQHFLSQTVTRRWREANHGRTVLTRFAFDTQSSSYLGTYGIGYVDDFVAIDSDAVEQLWSDTETHINAAVDAAIAKTALGNPIHESVLRKAVALHFARHPLIYENHEERGPRMFPESIKRLSCAGLWATLGSAS